MFVLEYYFATILFAIVREAFRCVHPKKEVPNKAIFRLARIVRDIESVCDRSLTVLTQDSLCVAEERLSRRQ